MVYDGAALGLAAWGVSDELGLLRLSLPQWEGMTHDKSFEEFLEVLRDSLIDLHDRQAKADVNIQLGRRDEQGHLLPPSFSVRTFVY